MSSAHVLYQSSSCIKKQVANPGFGSPCIQATIHTGPTKLELWISFYLCEHGNRGLGCMGCDSSSTALRWNMFLQSCDRCKQSIDVSKIPLVCMWWYMSKIDSTTQVGSTYLVLT